MTEDPLPLPSGTGRIGIVARWKPVHLGHAAVLRGMIESADHVLIGIGSSNRYDVQNPFTAAESAEMIRLALAPSDRFTLIEVPDLGHGPRWSAMVRELFQSLDAFVTANDYVRELMRELYHVVHPIVFVPPERRVRVDGTMVRRAMAAGADWRSLVPLPVAEFLERNGLVARFRREFGMATLAAGSE